MVEQVCLTSCLDSSALLPKALVAAEARSPMDWSLSLATSALVVSSFQYGGRTREVLTLVSLFLASRRRSLDSLRDLVGSVPEKWELVLYVDMAAWLPG